MSHKWCRTCSLTAITTEVRSLSSSFSMISFFRVRLKSLKEKNTTTPELLSTSSSLAVHRLVFTAQAKWSRSQQRHICSKTELFAQCESSAHKVMVKETQRVSQKQKKKQYLQLKPGAQSAIFSSPRAKMTYGCHIGQEIGSKPSLWWPSDQRQPGQTPDRVRTCRLTLWPATTNQPTGM